MGLEPTTSGLEVQCAIQLRHASVVCFCFSIYLGCNGGWGSDLLRSVSEQTHPLRFLTKQRWNGSLLRFLACTLFLLFVWLRQHQVSPFLVFNRLCYRFIWMLRIRIWNTLRIDDLKTNLPFLVNYASSQCSKSTLLLLLNSHFFWISVSYRWIFRNGSTVVWEFLLYLRNCGIKHVSG